MRRFRYFPVYIMAYVLDAVGKKPWENAEETAVFSAKKRENRIKTVYFF
jgi:hypothetical protein